MINTTAPRRRQATRSVLPTVVLAAALGLGLTACGGSGATGSSSGPSTLTVVVHHGATRATATNAAAPSTKTSRAAATPSPGADAAPQPRPTTLVTVRRPVTLRATPGAHGRALATLRRHTSFGSVTTLPVVRRRGAWLAVTALAAGNGRIGWLPRAAVSERSTQWRIYVSIARQRITVAYGNQIVKRFRTSTGVPGAATPTGHFAVTDRLRTGVQQGPYGCCILALSAVQPLHLSDWDGGNRIAIHATDAVSALGHPASHGCAHVDDADGAWLLAHIPDGTPVAIEQAPFHRGRGSPA
jgi:lipoprotein-anchoring transpeptidase ErfK/SrfK